MACGNDASLALSTHRLLPADRLGSPIEAVTPLSLRQSFCSETFSCVGLVTTAVQLTCISLIDSVEPEFVGTAPWLTDPMIVIYVSRLRNINHTNMMSMRSGRYTSHAPLDPVLTVCSAPLGEGLGGAPAAENEEDL
jgi:phosphoribulokinase